MSHRGSTEQARARHAVSLIPTHRHSQTDVLRDVRGLIPDAVWGGGIITIDPEGVVNGRRKRWHAPQKVAAGSTQREGGRTECDDRVKAWKESSEVRVAGNGKGSRDTLARASKRWRSELGPSEEERPWECRAA